MKRKLLWFLGASLGLWLAAAIPAYFIAGDRALIFAGCALALCLVPMTGTFLWYGWALQSSPENQLAAAMGGTAIRMFFVTVTGVILYQTVEFFSQPSFLIWVVFVYLATLFLEVVVSVRLSAKSS